MSWKQRLAYITCTIAFVGSLMAYKRQVTAHPLSLVQRHWEAIASQDSKQVTQLYHNDAILKRSQLHVNEVYKQEAIDLAWRKFFLQYDIESFEVINQTWRDRTIDAELEILTRSSQGASIPLSVSYQVQFDSNGKIRHEVWQINSQ
ncbi:MAG: hypothetical protein ACOC0N_09135 [Chroococcales cyanobacterium]